MLIAYKTLLDYSIYLTVLLGPLLLFQVYGLVELWLFSSLFVGWLLYIVAVVLIATNRAVGYALAFVLSLLVLATSLPQPEHYTFFSAGDLLAGVTFVIGSVLQLIILVLSPIYIFRLRKKARL
ncbi:MAG: hypothetical protein QXT39_03605 [Conexivisphaerales archaeon]